MPSLELFNPAIDRYDQRSAARLFESLWPDTIVARAVAENIASSIRVAHAISEACWEVTMFANTVRLNVGQVETLMCCEDEVRFLFRSPLHLGTDPRFVVSTERSPVFKAVPIPSGLCHVSPSDLVDMPAIVRTAHDAYIQAASSYKSVSPFKKSYSPAVIEYIEMLLATTLPRPSYAPHEMSGQRVIALPDELDPTQPRNEGARYQITVNAYERDPRARQLCIARHGTACVVCGFSFGATYGPVAEGFIHVHHLRPLSEIGGEYEVNPVEDLRPVCPNCHAVLHRSVPAFSIEDVWGFLLQQRQSKPNAAADWRGMTSVPDL